MEINIKLYGARELEELMVRELPPTVARSTLLAAMRKSAQPMLRYAQTKVPSPSSKGSSGALRHSLGIVTMRRGSHGKNFAALRFGALAGGQARALQAYAMYVLHYRGGRVRIRKGERVGAIRHAHFVEFGWTDRAGRKHPGRPYHRPAFEFGGQLYLSTFVRNLDKKITAAIKRHKAKVKIPAGRR